MRAGESNLSDAGRGTMGNSAYGITAEWHTHPPPVWRARAAALEEAAGSGEPPSLSRNIARSTIPTLTFLARLDDAPRPLTPICSHRI